MSPGCRMPGGRCRRGEPDRQAGDRGAQRRRDGEFAQAHGIYLLLGGERSKMMISPRRGSRQGFVISAADERRVSQPITANTAATRAAAATQSSQKWLAVATTA